MTVDHRSVPDQRHYWADVYGVFCGSRVGETSREQKEIWP